jgi:hypothetical protein
MNETRYLMIPESTISFLFSGQLNLVSGLFAGLPEVVCSYPITWSDPATEVVNLSNEDQHARPEIESWVDLMGRQLHHGPTPGQFSIALFSDGTRKVVWQQ